MFKNSRPIASYLNKLPEARRRASAEGPALPQPGAPGPLPTCPGPGLALGPSPEAAGLSPGPGRTWQAPGAAVCPRAVGGWKQARRQPPAPVTGWPTGRALALRLAECARAEGTPGGQASSLPCLALPRPFQEQARGNRAPGSGGSGHGEGAGATPPRPGPSPPASVPLRTTCCPVARGQQRPSQGPAPREPHRSGPATRRRAGDRPHGDTMYVPRTGAGRAVTPPHSEARASSFVVLNGEHNTLTKQEAAPRPRPARPQPRPPRRPRGLGPAPALPLGLAAPPSRASSGPLWTRVSHKLPRGPRGTWGREPGCDLGCPWPDS